MNLTNGEYLVSMNLSANHLKTFEFQDLEVLPVFDLYDNKLKAIDLGHAKQLEIIDFARNNNTSSLNLTLPYELLELSLSHSIITNIDDVLFKNLQKLLSLNLVSGGLHAMNPDLKRFQLR